MRALWRSCKESNRSRGYSCIRGHGTLEMEIVLADPIEEANH
jgi:hypothetical protein